MTNEFRSGRYNPTNKESAGKKRGSVTDEQIIEMLKFALDHADREGDAYLTTGEIAQAAGLTPRHMLAKLKGLSDAKGSKIVCNDKHNAFLWKYDGKRQD